MSDTNKITVHDIDADGDLEDVSTDYSTECSSRECSSEEEFSGESNQETQSSSNSQPSDNQPEHWDEPKDSQIDAKEYQIETKQDTKQEVRTPVKPGCAETLIEQFFKLKNSTVTAMFAHADNQLCLAEPRWYRWCNYVTLAKRFAMYLHENTKGNVAIHSFNCPEWFISAMGTICTGKLYEDSVPRFFCGIYNTNRDEQCMHIIKTGNCDTLVVENYTVLCEYYKNVFDQLRELKINIIVIDPSDLAKVFAPTLFAGLRHISWANLDLEKEDSYQPYPEEKLRFDPDDVCTLIFTSGTTGNPKAVEITHRNICTATRGVLDRFKLESFGERFVSYLPLSHIAGQAIDMYAPIFIEATTFFAGPDAMKGSLKNTLVKVKPTLFFGVPRVWEKFKEGLEKVAEKKYSSTYSGHAVGYLMSAIKKIEKNYNTTSSSYQQYALYPFTAVTSRVVNKIKEQMGLDKCKYFATGAAPIAKDVLEYFASIGICIFEVYGMSETCGVITVSDPVYSVKGSCGRPVKGVEVKIGDNSEILVKGDNVFNKYYNYDGSNGIDEKGYLHTGDCGKIDEKGYLYITGRIKELLITAGGENIPPVLIEDKIRSICNKHKFDPQLVLIGDKKKFLTALVFNPVEEKEIDQTLFKTIIKEYNDKHAISNSQKVQKFTVIRETLSIENGLLTPTMKVKRSKVVEKYAKRIDDMYAGSD